MGTTKLSKDEVCNLICDIAPRWLGGDYDVVHCNCISFCDELLGLLGADPVPGWVRSLQDAGAALLRAPRALGEALAGSVSMSTADDRIADDLLKEHQAKEQEYFEEVAVHEGQSCAVARAAFAEGQRR